MTLSVGDPAPEFTLPGTDGTPEGTRDYTLSSYRGQPLVLVFYALILLGGASGGWAVVRLSSRARLTHAAAAAALAYAIAQGIGVVLRLLRGDPLSWVAYPFLALMMACCGMLGGMFARRWQQQHEPGDDTEGGN